MCNGGCIRLFHTTFFILFPPVATEALQPLAFAVQVKEVDKKDVIPTNAVVCMGQHCKGADEILAIRNARIIQLEAELDMMKRQNMKYVVQDKALDAFLTPDQKKRLVTPKSSNFHWSDKMYDRAIQGYAAMHSKGYNFCRENILTPRLLPPIRSIQYKLAQVPCLPGKCTAYLKMTKIKVDVMEPHQKLCILKVDEMSLKPKLEFDMTNQTYCGRITLPLGKALREKRIKEKGFYDESLELATHAISAFIGLLCGNLDQLIGFNYTGNSFCPEAVAKWIIELVGAIKEIGLKCMGICMDMGTQNIAI